MNTDKDFFSYVLSTPEEDIQYFFNHIEAHEKKAECAEMAAKVQLEGTYNRIRYFIINSDLTLDHVRRADDLKESLENQLSTVQKTAQEADKKLKELNAQSKKNQEDYKGIVIANDEKAMRAAEDMAIRLANEITRHKIRHTGHSEAASQLNIKIELFGKLARLARHSILRQKAVIAIDEYKAAADILAPLLSKAEAIIDVGGWLLDSPPNLIGYLKSKKIAQKSEYGIGRFEDNPDYLALKRSIIDSIESEINQRKIEVAEPITPAEA